MKKAISMALAVLMLISVLPLSVMANEVDFDTSDSGCDFYNLIEKNDYALAPGAVESEIIINDANGTSRNVMHVIEVDLSNPQISVMPTYMGLNENSDFSDSSIWGSQVLTEQAAHVENDLGLNVVGGINTNLRYDSDHPYGVLVWNGVVYSDERNANGNSTAQTFLSVTKDGVASLHSANEAIPADSWQAISANFGWIIKNGVNQYKGDDHADANRAPRTVIGIKATGELILMMNDGRQSPYSAGMTMRELAEVMMAMGCVDAVNCDGGGSSTFISEREGTGELTMKSSPSDGGQRATLGGLLVISKAVADGQFDHATVKTEDSFVTPGSTVTFTATGADAAGAPAEIPAEGITWQLKNPAMGTVENGVFVSNGTVGTAVVQMCYNGEVVGQDYVEVVIPEAISFVQANVVVPYTKTAVLSMKATVNNGLNEVKLKAGDVNFTLSDSKLGTISGFNYTACTESAGVSSGVITATLVFNTAVTASANLSLGKGSEIVWDFEDGDISGLKFTSGYSSKHPAHPELGRFEFGSIEVVDASNGQVKNGDKALALECDYSQFYAMGYNMIRLSGLNINLKDAVRVGFWMYLTPEATGLELDFENWYEFNHGDAGSAAYPVAGWYYVSVDATKITKSTFNNLNFYHTDGYDAATQQNIPNIKTKFTVYIDDITVDYSTVVEDREAPTFSHVSILKDADTYEAMNGQTVSTNTITIMAEAKEDTSKTNYTGLDVNSVRVYVDGVRLNKGVSCASNGSISIDALTLSEGIHTVYIEIADLAGNYRGISRQIVIDSSAADAAVEFVPADPTLDQLPMGSIYYMNLNVQNIEDIMQITTVVNLDGSNKWELDYMEVAPGFTAEYTIDKFHNNATITITRTGDVYESGEAVLAKLPIRVWNYTVHLDFPDCVKDGKGCEFVSLPADMWAGDTQFRIAVLISLLKGSVTFIDGTTDTFSSEEYVIDTEMDKHRNIVTQAEKNEQVSWHYHIAEAVADKAPTCTEVGYIGRTVCVGCACGTYEKLGKECAVHNGCGSVVEWGTIIPATGHNFVTIDGVIACEGCGKLYNGEIDGLLYADGVLANGWINDTYYCVNGAKVTGLKILDRIVRYFDENGVYDPTYSYSGLINWGSDLYYAINNKFVSGWQFVDGNYYYFSSSNQKAANGVKTTGGYTYRFENFKLVEGQWVTSGENLKYMYAGRWCKNQWVTVNGVSYCFDGKAHAYIGVQKPTNHDKYYVFDETGAWLENYNGAYTWNGKNYYVIDGIAVNGLVEIGGYYYYVRSNGQFATGRYYTTTTNGLLPADFYVFGADGKMLNPPGTELKEGIHANENGVLCYYKGGIPTAAGLIYIDGYYYYARTGGILATGKYWTTNTNGLLEAKLYTFDTDGKMLNPNGEEIVGKTGIYEEDGVWYYYKNGEPFAAGLIYIDGYYYYARTGGILAIGKYWTTNHNGLMAAALYEFDAQGRMIIN